MKAADPRPLVLHVIHHLYIGGMENGLVNLINGMPEERFRHAIACIEDSSDFRERIVKPDVEIFALDRSKHGLMNVRKRLFQLCRKHRPSILHSRNMSALDALLPARLAGVAHFIHGEHGWDVNDLDGMERKPALLRRVHSPLINRYITVSQQLRTYLIKRVGVKATRISQIYNGVDTDRFVPAAHKSVGLTPPGYLTPGCIVIGTIGRIQPVKDQATLLRAFARLVNDQPALRSVVRLVIVGAGPLLPGLQELATELGVEPLVWLPGAADNVPEFLALMDIFVLPSLAEGISNTILEAMSSGLPVIASRVGGNPELVQDGKNGRLFDAGDAVELSQQLHAYVESPQLLREHAASARNRAVAEFALTNMIANYQAEYERHCTIVGETN